MFLKFISLIYLWIKIRCLVTCNRRITYSGKDIIQRTITNLDRRTLIDDTDLHQDKDDVQKKPMPPKRLQPLLQTDPAGITTKVTPEPLIEQGENSMTPPK